jgi:hypothetical protein
MAGWWPSVNTGRNSRSQTMVAEAESAKRIDQMEILIKS